MGYSLHICRGDWSADHPGKLKFEEWIQLAANDSEMLPENDEAKTALQWLQEGRDLHPSESKVAYFLWHGPDYDYSFYYIGFSIIVTGVACHVDAVRKMLQIAVKLGDWVQGDEGEFYDVIGEDIVVTRGTPRKAASD